MNKPTRYAISDAAVAKIREYTKSSLDHMPDPHIKRLLDECVTRASPEDIEEWWEDDRAYGIMKNTVIKVDESFEGATRKFYAILRPAFKQDFPGQMIVIGVIDEACRDSAIRSSRWMEKKPEGPTVGSLNYKALEKIKDHMITDPEKEESVVSEVKTEHPQPFLIKAGDYEYREPDLEQAKRKVMELILLDGHPIKDIGVFKQMPMGINVNLGEGDES